MQANLTQIKAPTETLKINVLKIMNNVDNYTVIAYRPDGDDYCMGCLMGRSSSDFELLCTEDGSEVIKLISNLLVRNHFAELAVSSYIITLLKNGIEQYESDSQYFVEAKLIADIKIKQKIEKAEKEKQEALKTQQSIKENYERNQLAELQEKYK